MNILLLSDSHAKSISEIPLFLKEMRGDLDLIFHAGDMTGDDFMRGLEDIAPVIAVRGNMDGGGLTGNLPERVQCSHLGWKFGIIHGRGAPESVPVYARSMFSDPDLIVFGHTHTPFLDVSRGVVLLNPGSLSSPRNGAPQSYARLILSKQEMDCRILTNTGNTLEEIARHTVRRSL